MEPSDKKILEGLEPVHLLALTLYGEARGEPVEGKIAVANVVNNRIRDNRWPDTLPEVVLQPKQFSCWNETDPNCYELIKRSKRGMYYDRDLSWRECIFAAHGLINGYLRDNTDGANHYHTVSVRPSWVDKMQKTARIGRHIFYRG